jgi:hypothetical protein
MLIDVSPCLVKKTLRKYRKSYQIENLSVIGRYKVKVVTEPVGIE